MQAYSRHCCIKHNLHVIADDKVPVYFKDLDTDSLQATKDDLANNAGYREAFARADKGWLAHWFLRHAINDWRRHVERQIAKGKAMVPRNSIVSQLKQAQDLNAQLKQLCRQIKEQGGRAYEFLPLGRAKGKVTPWELQDEVEGGDYEGSDDWGDGDIDEQLSKPALRTPDPTHHTSEPEIIDLDDQVSFEEAETTGYHRNAAGRLVKVRNTARDIHTGKFASSRSDNRRISSDVVMPSTPRKRPAEDQRP